MCGDIGAGDPAVGKQRQSPEANLYGEFHPVNNTARRKKGGPQPKKTTRGGPLVSTYRHAWKKHLFYQCHR